MASEPAAGHIINAVGDHESLEDHCCDIKNGAFFHVVGMFAGSFLFCFFQVQEVRVMRLGNLEQTELSFSDRPDHCTTDHVEEG